VKLKQARQQLSQFIQDTGAYPFDSSARTSVAGFGRSEASKATWAAKREEKFQHFYSNLNISSNKRSDKAELASYVQKISKTTGHLRSSDEAILQKLQKTGDWITIQSTEADLYTLGALTSRTGVEFASFSKQGTKIIVRGNTVQTFVPTDAARMIFGNQMCWDGHSHPTTGNLDASDNDRQTLKESFTWQKKSYIIDMEGTTLRFTANRFADIENRKEEK
jgi:hypothetical protein